MSDFSTGKYKFSDFVKLVDEVISGKKKNTSTINEALAVDEGMEEDYENIIDSLIASPNDIYGTDNPNMKTYMSILVRNMISVYNLLMKSEGDLEVIKKSIDIEIDRLEPEVTEYFFGNNSISPKSGIREIQAISAFSKTVSGSMVKNPVSVPEMQEIGEEFNKFIDLFVRGIYRIKAINDFEKTPNNKSLSPRFNEIKNGDFASFDSNLSKIYDSNGEQKKLSAVLDIVTKIMKSGIAVRDTANRTGGVRGLKDFYENVKDLFAYENLDELMEKAQIIARIDPVAVNGLKIDTRISTLGERSLKSSKPYMKMMFFIYSVAEAGLTTYSWASKDSQRIRNIIFDTINEWVGEDPEHDFSVDLTNINDSNVSKKIRGYKVLKLFVKALKDIGGENSGVQSNRNIDSYRTDGETPETATGEVGLGEIGQEDGLDDSKEDDELEKDEELNLTRDDISAITGGDGKVYNRYLEGEDIQAIVDGINDDLITMRSIGLTSSRNVFDVGCAPRWCLSKLSNLKINKMN